MISPGCVRALHSCDLSRTDARSCVATLALKDKTSLFIRIGSSKCVCVMIKRARACVVMDMEGRKKKFGATFSRKKSLGSLTASVKPWQTFQKSITKGDEIASPDAGRK